jgi:hypothetical protein
MQSKSTESVATAAASSGSVNTLTELCNDAAQHVAQARLALFTETADTDGALDHLDQAILCLKRFAVQGRALGFNGAKEELRSA